MALPQLEPKNGIRIHQDEVIALNYFASAAPTRLRASARVIYDDGSEQTFSIDADTFTTTRAPITLFAGGVNNTIEANAERARENGWIVTANVQRFGAARLQRGQMYVIMVVGGSTIESSILTQGYFFEGHDLRLGTYIEAGPAGGHGNIRQIALGNPAAGTNYVAQTVPTGAIWKHRGFAGQLVTAVAAANREASIQYLIDGVSQAAGTSASEIQTASLTVDYLGGNSLGGSGTSTALGTGTAVISLPDLSLPAGTIIGFTTYNIQAADDWGAGQIVVEEWVVPN